MKYLQGKFNPTHPSKYLGDIKQIYFRSSLELRVFKFLDISEYIKEWASEELFIPYTCITDRKTHRYFVDIYYKNSENEQFLIEIKPKKFLTPPKKGKSSKKYLKESLSYHKNLSKWDAAKEFAMLNSMNFQIWTEDTLKQLGI